MLETLFFNILVISLPVSVIIALLLILQPVLNKKYSAKWRYWVWLILAVRLLVPFNPTFQNALVQIPQPANIQNAIQDYYIVPNPDNVATPNADADSAAPQKPTKAVTPVISILEVLSFVWAAGAILFLLYHVWGYLLFKRSVARFSRPIHDRQTIKIWQAVQTEMNIRRKIPLLLCRSVQSPMMTGFRRPVLLLPHLDFDDTELEIILYHESIHYKRKDIWYKLLLSGANAVHWFNPLVYWMSSRSNKDIEMVCDSEVVKGGDMAFKKQYGHTILSAVHNRNLRQLKFSTYFYGGKEIMQDRFNNIFDAKKKHRGIPALCVILIMVCMIGGLVACQDAAAVMQNNPNTPTAVSNQPSDTSPSPMTSAPADNSAGSGSSKEKPAPDDKTKDAQSSASTSVSSKNEPTKDTEKSSGNPDKPSNASAEPTNNAPTDAGEIAQKTKEYLINGQEEKSEAEKLHWSQTFLNQVDIEAVYKKYISKGGKAGDIKKFAAYLTGNAPVPSNWKELFEADFHQSYEEKITRYEDLKNNYYQVYVEIDGKEVPYVGLNTRTGWFHG